METPSFVSSFTPPLRGSLTEPRCRHRTLLCAQVERAQKGDVDKNENNNASTSNTISGDPTKVPPGKVYAPRQIRGGGRCLVGNIRTQGHRYVRLPPNPPGLRVASGSAKGRLVKSPNVYLRPMMAKVREALFSMLRVFNAVRPDATVLDLYCGSGSVGIEALSRGIKHATFVDYATECINTTGENLTVCGFSDRSRTVCTTVEEFLKGWRDSVESKMPDGSCRHFDLITITPPYEEVDYANLMDLVVTSGCVGEGTFVVVEYPVELKTMPPTIQNRLIGIRNRKYGRTMVAVYACQPHVDLVPRPDEFVSSKRR